jgi:hypothetical protein
MPILKLVPWTLLALFASWLPPCAAQTAQPIESTGAQIRQGNDVGASVP